MCFCECNSYFPESMSQMRKVFHLSILLTIAANSKTINLISLCFISTSHTIRKPSTLCSLLQAYIMKCNSKKYRPCSVFSMAINFISLAQQGIAIDLNKLIDFTSSKIFFGKIALGNFCLSLSTNLCLVTTKCHRMN